LFQLSTPDSELKGIVQEFRKHIQDSENIHPNRFTPQNLSSGISHMTPSTDSNLLNEKLNAIENGCTITNTATNNTFPGIIQEALNGLSYACKTAMKSPYKTFIALGCIALLAAQRGYVINPLAPAISRPEMCPLVPSFVSNAEPLQFPSAFCPTLDYNGIPALDISDVRKYCWRKSIGASAGKKCYMPAKIYYFKTLVETQDNPNNDVLLGEYNRRFLADNVNIRVPKASIVAEKINGTMQFSIASEALPNFVQADTYCESRGNLNCVYSRQKIVSVLGEHALAQLAVANTFIDDLHSLNWGHVNKELTIIDADKSPMTLRGYFEWTAKKFRSAEKGSIGFEISLDNIAAMKTIYENMLEKPVPVFHKKTDITKETYKTLLNAFIEVCKTVLKEAKMDLPDLSKSTPDLRINQIFSGSMLNIARTSFRLQDTKPVRGYRA
jgi:hypothetical protein